MSEQPETFDEPKAVRVFVDAENADLHPNKAAEPVPAPTAGTTRHSLSQAVEMKDAEAEIPDEPEGNDTANGIMTPKVVNGLASGTYEKKLQRMMQVAESKEGMKEVRAYSHIFKADFQVVLRNKTIKDKKLQAHRTAMADKLAAHHVMLNKLHSEMGATLDERTKQYDADTELEKTLRRESAEATKDVVAKREVSSILVASIEHGKANAATAAACTASSEGLQTALEAKVEELVAINEKKDKLTIQLEEQNKRHDEVAAQMDEKNELINTATAALLQAADAAAAAATAARTVANAAAAAKTN